MRAVVFIALCLPLTAFAAPPVVDAVAPQTVNENQAITIPVNASDPDGDAIVLTTSTLPANAIFTDQGNGNGFIQFTPDFTQAGDITITLTATDNAAVPSASSTDIAITVVNVNRPPIINGQAIIQATVGDTATANFVALDPDGDTVTFSGENLPPTMIITNNAANSSAVISYTPAENEIGSFTVAINADDGTQISAIPLDVIVDAGPVEARCSTSPASTSSPTLLWSLLLGAFLLRRRNLLKSQG